MKKTSLIIFVFLVPLLVLSQKSNPLKITSNPDVEYQTMDGFGASDAWRCQFVGKNWPLEKREAIADLLFSLEDDKNGNPKGIGLSIWRFYLSAGTTELGDSSGIPSEWRRGECFQNPDGTYDWTKHEGQRWFLQAAKKREVEKFLAFTNSAPAHMTNNGLGYATKGDTHLNLKAGKFDDYSRFMVDVLDHFEKEGFHFEYLSPINEPQWNWDGNSQEGTPASNDEIYSLVRYLSKDLSDRGLKTKILIGEAGTIGHASLDMGIMGMESDGRDNQAQFFFNEDSPFYIGDLPNVEKTISAHSYYSVWPLNKQVEYRLQVNKLLKQANANLKYWQSEYCILQPNDELGVGNGRDLSMKTALYVARIIHNDLVLTNASSWQWWTALSQVDFKDGLIYLDDGKTVGSEMKDVRFDGRYLDSKLLWTLGNYSRFVRPGMVRIQCDLSEKQSVEDGLLISAYKEPTSGKLVYIMVNLSEKEQLVDLGISKKVELYTTSKESNLERSVSKANRIKLSKRSIITVIQN